MHIGIVGAGVAGSYLSYRLSKQHTVEVFERKTREDLARNCAWGTSRRTLQRYCDICGLDPQEYLHHTCRKFLSDIYVNRDSISFNKRKFLLDLLGKSEATVHFENTLVRQKIKEYDLVIDATGPYRELLPKSRGKLSQSWISPTFQLDVRSDELPNDFYCRPRGVGYLWVVPQEENKAKVGCGSFDYNPKKAVMEFLADKAYEETYRTGGFVRMLPPSKSKPFHVKGESFVIGVGESIGTVSPIDGEGITSCLLCSDIFLSVFQNNSGLEKIAKRYEQKILREFEWIDSQFKFIRALRFENRFSQFLHLLKLSVPAYSARKVSKVGMLMSPLT